MINFVVLKDSLNFGFLSYRISGSTTAKFTIFNQPSCIDFPNDGDKEVEQFGTDTFNFNDYMINDNFPGAELIILETNSGITIDPVSDSDGTKIVVNSNDYISGEIQFIFKVKNGFFESDECTGTIKVKGCFRNCKTCISEQNYQLGQECVLCKDDYFKIDKYPNNSYSDNSLYSKEIFSIV